MIRNFILSCAVATLFAVPASAVTVLTNDFEGPGGFPTVTPGITTALSLAGGAVVGSQSFPSTGTMFFRNATKGVTTLTLTGLPVHNQITLNIDVAFIDSWDSSNGSPAPDNLVIRADGTEIGRLTAANASGSIDDFDGGTLLGRGDFGFSTGTYFDQDAIARISYAFSHSASSLTFEWYADGKGFQSGDDESWGIDNLAVITTLNTVPTPAPAGFALFGLAAFSLGLRRR